MKKHAVSALAATLSLTALIAAAPATAATRHHHEGFERQRSAPGFYEGDYEYRVDRRDRTSSPYAGGVG